MSRVNRRECRSRRQTGMIPAPLLPYPAPSLHSPKFSGSKKDLFTAFQVLCSRCPSMTRVRAALARQVFPAGLVMPRLENGAAISAALTTRPQPGCARALPEQSRPPTEREPSPFEYWRLSRIGLSVPRPACPRPFAHVPKDWAVPEWARPV